MFICFSSGFSWIQNPPFPPLSTTFKLGFGKKTQNVENSIDFGRGSFTLRALGSGFSTRPLILLRPACHQTIACG